MINFKEMNDIEKLVLDSFLKYVQIDTESDPSKETNPTTDNQWDLAKVLCEELKEIGLTDAVIDDHCYVYATLPASEGITIEPISFLAHMDTAPAVSGINVKPIIRKDYQGQDLAFPHNKDITLTPKDSPELLDFIGEDIITASGDTLLGADDKAGIAEIMTALKMLVKFPEITHPELKICFTPDEEVGLGTNSIDIDKLGKVAYTMDGGGIGEIEDECFDAHGVKINITGRNVHPGSAKNIMINAIRVANDFISLLPENETPEHTEKREGFYHIGDINGNESNVTIDMIIRDFEAEKNLHRIDYINNVVSLLSMKYPGVRIDVIHNEQYKNMNVVLKEHKDVSRKISEVLYELDIKTIKNPIRGGTDGARLSFMGVPTPNIFAGGYLFHSNKEWVPVSSMVAGVKVVIALAHKWAE